MQIQVSTSSVGIMPILNSNRITGNRQKEAVMAMGLAACQARCGHCAHHCGK